MNRVVRTAGSLTVLGLALAGNLAAHDIPNDLTIQAYLKPQGSRLELLVRVPLRAMRDIDYPRRGRDFVDLARAEPALREAAIVWIAREVDVYEGARLLSEPNLVRVRASQPSDDSFRSYETVIASLIAPGLPESTDFVWNQGFLDVFLEYPIDSERSQFSIQPRWARLGIQTVTALRFMPPGTSVRAFEFVGDPGVVRLDPRWHQAAARFVWLGFVHILDGTDHLLFLVCLVIPFRRLRTLAFVVTAFAVAHSMTLVASVYDVVPAAPWFPPLVETLIAVSILYMALENIASPGLRRRWLLAFGFGLVHGFGFSFALRQTLQFAGSHLLTSLLSFNVGVELGQLFVLMLLIPALNVLFRFAVAERTGTIILSALVAHTAWHWMTDRWGQLRQYPFHWPAFTPDLMVTAIRWLTLAVIAGGVAWLFSMLGSGSRESRAKGQPLFPPLE